MRGEFKTIPKGWGRERIFVSTDQYCGKFMDFGAGKSFSFHFHDKKVETWVITKGIFDLKILDTADASVETIRLNVGDIWTNDRLVPHQLTCIQEGTVLEVSTKDDISDNYRVFPGDSQKSTKIQDRLEQLENVELVLNTDSVADKIDSEKIKEVFEEEATKSKSYHHGDMRSYWER